MELSVPEVRRLFQAMSESQEHQAHRLHWSRFRRQHQARAQRFHRLRRARQAPAVSADPPAPRGKLKVIGRIAGQMASMVFALLKTDQETLSQVPPGEVPPPPMLYDPAIHRKHQEGHYRSLKPGTRPRTIIQLPKKT